MRSKHLEKDLAFGGVESSINARKREHHGAHKNETLVRKIEKRTRVQQRTKVRDRKESHNRDTFYSLRGRHYHTENHRPIASPARQSQESHTRLIEWVILDDETVHTTIETPSFMSRVWRWMSNRRGGETRTQ